MITYSYIRTTGALTVHFSDGASFTWTADNPRYEDALNAIKAKESDDAVRALMDVKRNVVSAVVAYGDFTVNDDGVFYKGKLLSLSLTERIVQMVSEGFDALPMLKFLEKLLKNPRREAVQSLYDFMEHNKLPLYQDGDFIAYKIVREDYKDIYTGQIDNSVGASPKMEPWEVEADRNKTCSEGLHVCSKEYLPHYGSGGSRIMVVKVNPERVVAVPFDYNNAKMRVWTYDVIAEMDKRESAEILEKYSVLNPTVMSGESDNFVWGAVDEDEESFYIEDEEEDVEEGVDNATQQENMLRRKYPSASPHTISTIVDESLTYGSVGPYVEYHAFAPQNTYYHTSGSGMSTEVSADVAQELVNHGSESVEVVYRYDKGSLAHLCRIPIVHE